MNEPKKGPKYAHRAVAGDLVHLKSSHVTSSAQLKRWYGTRHAEMYLTGRMIGKVTDPHGEKKGIYYIVEVTLPGPAASTKVCCNKNIFHFPGARVDPKPPPRVSVHGFEYPSFALTDDGEDDSHDTVLLQMQQMAKYPPAQINTNDDSSVLSELIDSQLNEDTDGETVVDEPGLRPVSVDQFVKPAFVNAHKWFAIEKARNDDTNGPIPRKKWWFIGNDGEHWEPNDDPDGEKWTPLEYFLTTMPPAAMKRILTETNKKLLLIASAPIDTAELLRFFGICLLVTRCEFGAQCDLWSHSTGCKNIPSANFGATGMSRNRYKEIWIHLTFSVQEPVLPANMNSAEHRWTLVDDFVGDYNRHRRAKFYPSEKVRTGSQYVLILHLNLQICIDESISRWYGMGVIGSTEASPTT
jgi:Transposase IS4